MSAEKSLILVVDDNKENLRVVSSLLKTKGYQIALSLNADNAYQVLESHTVDLILLDIMMPVEDGYSFCRRIKQEERFREIPVIFLTALTEPQDLVTGFQAGGIDYITKPFRKEELFARVKSHVDLSNAKRDIIRQAEVIKKINQTRDLMYSIISHDIRSPFASISMMVSMLAEGYLEADSEEFQEIIINLNRSTKETYALLENLLQWTKTQTGNLECHPKEVDLKSALSEPLSIAQMRADMKKIALHESIPEGLTLMIDGNMFGTVLRNLLSNAVKYTEEGGEIKIIAKDENERVLIEVIDNGIGMDQEQLQKLFRKDIFHTTTGTQNEKGSGLGLHLVKEFTELNGGTVSVESELGKGSTFRLEFPNKQNTDIQEYQ